MTEPSPTAPAPLSSLIARVKPLDPVAMRAARERLDRLTKPPGSLGRLEDLAIHLAGMGGRARPRVRDKVVVLMAGDHGVVQEGVSAYPQPVTRQMLANIAAGGAAVSVLARQTGARMVIVDMGTAGEPVEDPAILQHRVAAGTGNITRGPAMTPAQAEQALVRGAQVVAAEITRGMDILALGEMGIGNTTPSAAIAAVITAQPLDAIVGHGTGVDNAGLRRKVSAVSRALAVNQPDPTDGLDILAKVGGFEIGGLAGAVLAAAAARRPVMIDGFISTAAAMIAALLQPRVKQYLVASHASVERGHRLMLDWLCLEPLFDLRMRLGEGSGAVLALPLADAACRLLDEMATFEEAGVSKAV